MKNKPKVEFVNNEHESKWRLIWGDEASEWTSHYTGILTHEFSNGQTWGLATDYWLGFLPTETPFQIVVP